MWWMRKCPLGVVVVWVVTSVAVLGGDWNTMMMVEGKSSSRSRSRSRRSGRMPSLFGLGVKGGSTSTSTTSANGSLLGKDKGGGQQQSSQQYPIRVAFQGEPGAYSEKAMRELLGEHVIAVPRPNFEACYRAVANRECDYACLPVENSLGGSIHENYDLMLRYDLTIVAEHECRVSHCLLAVPGIDQDKIKYCLSHPQALAQCDNYLRARGITPVPFYDTAGSAKLLMDQEHSDRNLPDLCSPENTAAIASDLAGRVYGLDCLDKAIEDDDSNFTRFLLLGRMGVSQYLNSKIPSKTSIVFTLPNTPGALYKALACFSLRDVDFSKIESRPTSASLLNYLKFKSQINPNNAHNNNNNSNNNKQSSRTSVPRFRYCFYLDFLKSEWDDSAQHALQHLREQANFVRVLGSYPQKSRLVGPVATERNIRLPNNVQDPQLHLPNDSHTGTTHSDDNNIPKNPHQLQLPSDREQTSPLKIGIIGYGVYGQYLGSRLAASGKKNNNIQVSCMDPIDKSKQAGQAGVTYYHPYEMSRFLRSSDVIVLAVPLVDFESTVASLPHSKLRGKLVIEVCPLSIHPKQVLQKYLGPHNDIDLLCTHPMFGPTKKTAYTDELSSTSTEDAFLPNDAQWDGQPMFYDKVHITNPLRANRFLDIFEEARCQMVEMSAEEHDACIADADFVTHLTGWLLSPSTGGGSNSLLPPTPVASKEYEALCDVTDLTSTDTFDLFYGMYKFNAQSQKYLEQFRQNLALIDRKLAAKEAYLAASDEMKNTDRQRLIDECKKLLQDVVTQSHPPLPSNNNNNNNNETKEK